MESFDPHRGLSTGKRNESLKIRYLFFQSRILGFKSLYAHLELLPNGTLQLDTADFGTERSAQSCQLGFRTCKALSEITYFRDKDSLFPSLGDYPNRNRHTQNQYQQRDPIPWPRNVSTHNDLRSRNAKVTSEAPNFQGRTGGRHSPKVSSSPNMRFMF